MGESLDHISVMNYPLFWRWAVIPLSLVGKVSAIAFYRKRDAERMARAIAEECGGVMLLRRRGWRTFELGGHIRDERCDHR
jgi:hypothetical protein